MSKYIFVTGGVCSSLGKGVASSSLGTLLECRGLLVRMIKIDPYLNVDAGTMSPFQHGEVYVTDDGAETDLDLGNYARFTSSPLSQSNSITTGQIYHSVIQKERAGKYLGKCVQVVPHITDEIKRRLYSIGEQPGVDITIVEVGGTVGDIESIPYLEAIRQIIHEKNREDTCSIHLALIPTVSCGEVKTKPAQHSVKSMREIGIQPQVLLCRCEQELSSELKKKISLFTNIDEDAVISAHNITSTLYEIPLIYHQQGMDEAVVKRLNLKTAEGDFSQWKKVVEIYKKADTILKVAMVGKYIQLDDAYKSIDEAVRHGALANGVRMQFVKIDSEELEENNNPDEIFSGVDAILVPGGFGERGIRGMVMAANYAREKNIPYLGICLGMQIMVIEYARNVLGLTDANSSEFNVKTPHPVISPLEDQIDIVQYGGTMRLGGSESKLKKGTKIYDAYGTEIIWERHRHRYEVTNRYRDQLSEAGLTISGTTVDDSLVESVEWENHPFGVGVQFHPEFTSQPVKAGPLFKAYMKAALEHRRSKKD